MSDDDKVVNLFPRPAATPEPIEDEVQTSETVVLVEESAEMPREKAALLQALDDVRRRVLDDEVHSGLCVIWFDRETVLPMVLQSFPSKADAAMFLGVAEFFKDWMKKACRR